MNTANPYAAPTTPIAIREVAPQPRLLSGILVGSFFGTVASGAIFRLIGGPFGMVIGGIPVSYTHLTLPTTPYV